MRPRCGAKLAKSYSHCAISIRASHGIRFWSALRTILSKTLTSAKRSTNQNAAHLVMKLRYDHCHARQLCRADREKVWDCSLGRFFGSGRHVPQHCARPTPCCAKEALGGVARDYVSGSSPLESHDVVRPAATLGFYR